MINKISFKGYKSFKDLYEIELKPITILIGKNNSGKSALAKLPTLIENSLKGIFSDPVLTNNEGVELGAEFSDLIYGRGIGSLELIIESNNNKLTVEIASGVKETDLPRIRKWILNNDYDLKYNDSTKDYFDENKKKYYQCNFSGFNLNKLYEGDKPVLESSEGYFLKEKEMTLKTDYIGPFRVIPNRTYTSIGNQKLFKMGNSGENAYKILITDFLYNEGILLKKISEWYKNNFEGWEIIINTQSKPDYKIELSRKDPQFTVNICDVGQGISQSLPLIVGAFIDAKEDTLTIIEQPELHLHPAAHGNLAELFANSTKNKFKRFLIETHSRNFVLRLRRLIAEEKFNKEDLSIYSVEYDAYDNKSIIKSIKVNDLGEVSYWPDNVFSESIDEAIGIKNAQIKKTKNGH